MKPLHQYQEDDRTVGRRCAWCGHRFDDHGLRWLWRLIGAEGR